MFSRSAARALSRASIPARTVSRRWASSHAKPSSDLPWLATSTVVFGGATAYLLTSGGSGHAEHAVHHGTTSAKEATAAREEEESDSKPEEPEIQSAEESSIQRSLDTDAPPVAQAAEEHGIVPSLEKVIKAPTEEDAEPTPASPSSKSEDKKEDAPAEKSESSDDEGRKAEDIPQEELDTKGKDSLAKEEKIGVPGIAKEEEEK